MCLLVFKPADTTIPFDHLSNGANQNPHGSGVAIADGNKIIIQKGPKWGAEEIAKVLEKFKGHPAIVHFRFATHGSKNFQNTHPFWLNQKWCAAHNGVINISTNKDESDTRAFLRVHVKPILAEDMNIADPDVINLLATEMGSYNKMVYLNAEGDYGIANEKSGHWNKGIWYSNHNYEEMSSYAAYGYWDRHSYRPSTVCGNQTTRCLPHRRPNPAYVIRDAVSSQFPPDCDEISEDLDVANDSFHRLDTDKLQCDICNQKIKGEFKIGKDTGILICQMCEFFDESGGGEMR